MDKSNLGDRMKEYESASSSTLTRRLPVIIRLDGKAFHTYTKGLERPWDKNLIDVMGKTACALVDNIQGCKIAYVQSDEISLLLTNNDSVNTSAWFDNKVQKIVSISASLATYYFNRWASVFLPYHNNADGTSKIALFDSRVFVLPENEVNNYFYWRQKDATRNSISMLAQSKFSHKVLQGKNSSQMQEMLFSEFNINWNSIETHLKRGWCCYKVKMPHIGKNEQTGETINTFRTETIEDRESPVFSQDKTFLEKLL